MEFTDRLVVMTCWCGINHAVPEDLRAYQMRCHNDGRKVPDIHCPLGHGHVPAGRPEHEVLAERLEQEQRRAGRLAAQRDQAEASARAYKGAATKARKRAGAGVCPCCKRSFQQLRRHMASKHPDFDAEAVAK